MRVKRIRWDERSEEHISFHNVEPDEVEQVAEDRPWFERRRGVNRYYMYGQTEEGRYLLGVIDHEGQGILYCVTARDMEEPERRLYFRHVRK